LDSGVVLIDEFHHCPLNPSISHGIKLDFLLKVLGNPSFGPIPIAELENHLPRGSSALQRTMTKAIPVLFPQLN
jgi:hypothetical protein